MPKVTVLPHPGICPNGAEFEVPEGANLAKALVANGVNIDHACEFSCACTTCHCYIGTKALTRWSRLKTMKKICLIMLGV